MPDGGKGIEITIRYVPRTANEWMVTREIAKVLHSDNFGPIVKDRVINFRVQLEPSDMGGIRNTGNGTLCIPDEVIGQKFLRFVREEPIKMENNKLRFYPSGKLSNAMAETLAKTPYVNPDIEEERSNKLRDLEGEFRVDRVQFGVFYRDKYPSATRSFSVEWQKEYIKSHASFSFDYDHKKFHLKVNCCVS